MWLSNSSVGRKFIMAITGAVLVLFLTFHCLMNAIAIVWPAAYNSVCLFLGANWYALIASAGLAAFILVHIIYAVMLTVQNRRARGHERYAVAHRPKSVEWSSQNMLVLGIVIVAFLVVHMIQFWAKMQLVEVLGAHTTIPAAAGTLFLQEAFQLPWTLVVYCIGFIALWFHLNHGIWSMFQSVGWDSTAWIPRLKKIATWWCSIVVALFIAEGVVFTVKANQNFYLNDPELREQYKAMVVPEYEDDFGPGAVQQLSMLSFDEYSRMVRSQFQQMQDPQAKAYFGEKYDGMMEVLGQQVEFLDYLEAAPAEEEAVPAPSTGVSGNK
ncbi:MAG: succinate dehydrogenase cytochrome b subunit [Muribaculaceae bacterium]|nr:succinate dehydrogenase cytochrome b subunit [Muribaculaceae bacterium]MDE6448341.1 succinate dehydrogenase cytochrome b subunit [Muribaculaceae bacterium]MDE7343387.1 succinate dehydrogenase cytochrome b subunit [Muribaculaceae bacterium]